MEAIKNKIKQNILPLSLFLALGAVYFIITKLTPFRIPCILYKFTGFSCPGCGMTHFCVDVLHGRFIEAAKENLAGAVIFPLFIIYMPLWIAMQKNHKIKADKILRYLEYVSIVIFIIFGILRNIPGLEFLRPSYVINQTDLPFIKPSLYDLIFSR